MKQSLDEAAYQNEQKMLIDADIRVSEEEASYYEGLRDGIIESASKSFIAGVEWQKKRVIEAHKILCSNYQNGSCTVFGKNKNVSDCWNTYAGCDMKCKYMNNFINSL